MVVNYGIESNIIERIIPDYLMGREKEGER